jgi:hypothetical protein
MLTTGHITFQSENAITPIPPVLYRRAREAYHCSAFTVPVTMHALVPGEWTLVLIQGMERLNPSRDYPKMRTKGFRYAFITCGEDKKTTVLDVKAFLEHIDACDGETAVTCPASRERTLAVWYDAVAAMKSEMKGSSPVPVVVTACHEEEMGSILSMMEVFASKESEYLERFGA